MIFSNCKGNHHFCSSFACKPVSSLNPTYYAEYLKQCRTNAFLPFLLVGQSYNRDMFLFLNLLLVIVSVMTSLKKHNDKSPLSGKAILYLNRHQTEEWKGYMQASRL